jgi:hypothetical protein
MIPDPKLNIWEHSNSLKELCLKRARNIVEEMDSAAQAAQIIYSLNLSPHTPILDGGCGAGHFIHSLIKRGLDLDYHGLDYSPSYIEIGKMAFSELSFDPERLFLESLDDLYGHDFNVALIINVMSFNPDFRRILGRLVENGAETIIVRDNFGEKTVIRWDIDGFLDEGFNHLKAYWNLWGRNEVETFLNDLGYRVSFLEDKRTKGEVELVVGKPYTWEFLLAQKG